MRIGKIIRTGLPVILFIFVMTAPSHAQRKKTAAKADTLILLNQDMDTLGLSKNVKTIILDSAALKRPKIAAYYAAAFPGLGQIYNKNYWKLPILYGGAAVLGYYIDWNNKKYHQFMQGLADQRSGNLSNILATAPADRLKQQVDYFRRNRDYDMIILAGVYLLQIVDAHVQAHLVNFDINEDLSLRVEPVLEDGKHMARYAGIGIVLKIN